MKNQPKDYVDARERIQNDDDLPSVRWWVGYLAVVAFLVVLYGLTR